MVVWRGPGSIFFSKPKPDAEVWKIKDHLPGKRCGRGGGGRTLGEDWVRKGRGWRPLGSTLSADPPNINLDPTYPPIL